MSISLPSVVGKHLLTIHRTGYKNAKVDTKTLFFNSSYAGPMSDDDYVPNWPNPTNSSTCAHGMGVLKSVVQEYKGKIATYNYSLPYPYVSTCFL